MPLEGSWKRAPDVLEMRSENVSWIKTQLSLWIMASYSFIHSIDLLPYITLKCKKKKKQKTNPGIIRVWQKQGQNIKRLKFSPINHWRESAVREKEENYCCPLSDSYLLHLTDEPYVIHIIFPSGNALPTTFT